VGFSSHAISRLTAESLLLGWHCVKDLHLKGIDVTRFCDERRQKAKISESLRGLSRVGQEPAFMP
jgi:hypothetical protein